MYGIFAFIGVVEQGSMGRHIFHPWSVWLYFPQQAPTSRTWPSTDSATCVIARHRWRRRWQLPLHAVCLCIPLNWV